MERQPGAGFQPEMNREAKANQPGWQELKEYGLKDGEIAAMVHMYEGYARLEGRDVQQTVQEMMHGLVEAYRQNPELDEVGQSRRESIKKRVLDTMFPPQS